MDGSPQLLTNIQFAEAKKGYDRDQVDNFLRELSGKVGELQDMLRLATRRAEAAEVALAEAQKGRSAAEAAAAKAVAAAKAAPAPPTTPASEIEAATGVLAMAQKTADATVGDAEAKARDIIADARDRAATVVVEVEREAERLKGDANAQADRLVEERVAVIEEDVARLSSQRDGLQLDVDLLRHYLDEHRTKIRAGLDDINRILDQPGGLTPDRAPELGGMSNDTLIDSVSRRSASSGERTGASADRSDPVASGPEHRAATDTPAPSDSPASAGSASTPEPPTRPAPSTEGSAPGSASSAPAASSATDVRLDDTPRAQTNSAPAPAGDATPAPPAPEPAPERPIVTIEDLASGDAGADDRGAGPSTGSSGLFGADPDAGAAAAEPGPSSLFSQSPDEPTQAYDVLAGEAGAGDPTADDAPMPTSSTLGKVDDDADEAMRAFFEQDLDADDKDDKPRGFLRRR